MTTLSIVKTFIFVFTGLNPILFCKKCMPSMAQVFSMGSSNASLPLNIIGTIEWE